MNDQKPEGENVPCSDLLGAAADLLAENGSLIYADEVRRAAAEIERLSTLERALQSLWPDLRQLVDGFTTDADWNNTWDTTTRNRMIAFGMQHMMPNAQVNARAGFMARRVEPAVVPQRDDLET